jgi:hypothetical protein
MHHYKNISNGSSKRTTKNVTDLVCKVTHQMGLIHIYELDMDHLLSQMAHRGHHMNSSLFQICRFGGLMPELPKVAFQPEPKKKRLDINLYSLESAAAAITLP